MTDPYWFTATAVLDVHDGDTLRMHLVSAPYDAGFGAKVHAEFDEFSCRLLMLPVMGLNAIELGKPGGIAARDHLRSLLADHDPLRVLSVKWDKWARRFDGVVYLPDGSSVGDLMVRDGYAVPWDGKGPAPVPPWPIPGR